MKAGAIGRQLEQHAARLAEVNRLEPKAVDHRGRMCSAAQDLFADFELMRLIFHPPCDVMHAPGAPGSASGVGRRLQIDVLPRAARPQPVALPSPFLSNCPKAQSLLQKRNCLLQFQLQQARAFQAADLELEETVSFLEEGL